MCLQCAAGAMTAVAGASGMRLWLEARFPGLMGPRTKKIVRRTLVGIGLLVAGLLGGSGASPASATAGASSTPVVPAAAGPVHAMRVGDRPAVRDRTSARETAAAAADRGR